MARIAAVCPDSSGGNCLNFQSLGKAGEDTRAQGSLGIASDLSLNPGSSPKRLITSLTVI